MTNHTERQRSWGRSNRLRGSIHCGEHAALGVMAAVILAGCATVKVEPPSEPIEINLNVRIEGELRVKLDREIETLIDENPDIF
ncbi:MAG: YnbE family lipoprotein [Pseudomonadota bacterium]